MRALAVSLALLSSFTYVDRAGAQDALPATPRASEPERALRLLETDNAHLQRRIAAFEQELDAANKTQAGLSARSDELEQAVHHQSALVAHVTRAFGRDARLAAQAAEARRAREAVEYWRDELAQKRVAHALTERKLQLLRTDQTVSSTPPAAFDLTDPLAASMQEELDRRERRRLEIALAEAAETDAQRELRFALERAMAAESERDRAYAAQTRAVMTAASLSRSDPTARAVTRAGAIILGFALVVLFAVVAVSVSVTKGRMAAEKAAVARHTPALEPETLELLESLAGYRAALPLAQTIFAIACWTAGTLVVGLALASGWLIVRQGGIDFVVARELLGGVVLELALAITAVLAFLFAVVVRFSAQLTALRCAAWDRRLIVLEPDRVLDYERWPNAS